MVISGFEEKCLNCSVPISGTIQVQAENSYTAGDFDANHNVDQQSSGTDRAMRVASVTGTCRACGASFSYKMFAVMQLRLRDKAAQQS
jgi:hypothetical protein